MVISTTLVSAAYHPAARERLVSLEDKLKTSLGSAQRQNFLREYVDLALSCGPSDFIPNELEWVRRRESLNDPNEIARMYCDPQAGSRQVELPLRYIAKLLTESHCAKSESFILLLGGIPEGEVDSIEIRNYRALEYALVMFGKRISPGNQLNLKINSQHITVEHIGGRALDNDPWVEGLRRNMRTLNIGPSGQYFLTHINDEGQRVDTKFFLRTDEKIFEGRKVLISYIVPIGIP